MLIEHRGKLKQWLFIVGIYILSIPISSIEQRWWRNRITLNSIEQLQYSTVVE